MTTKEWLGQYRSAKNEALHCFDELDRLCETLLKSPQMTGMPRGGEAKDLADMVAARERIRERAHRARERAIRLMDEITEAIEAVEDGTQRTVLMRRYIDCLRWDEIAVLMGYTTRQLYRLHGKALANVKREGV